MTVRTSGTLIVGAADFVRIDRGITWCIKVTDASEASFVAVFVKNGDAWASDPLGESMLEPDFIGAVMKDYGGNVRAWFTGKLLPALNAYLRVKFPAAAGVNLSAAEQADQMIGLIRIIIHADGTLTAE